MTEIALIQVLDDRPSIFEAVADGIDSLIRVGKEYDLSITPFIFVQKHYKDLYLKAGERHGIERVWGLHSEALTDNLNQAFQDTIKISSAEYIMQIGADNIISTEYIPKARDYIKQKIKMFAPASYIAIKLGQLNGKLVKFFQPIGVGRVMHRSLIEHCYMTGRSVYTHGRTSGLDTNSMINIMNADESFHGYRTFAPIEVPGDYVLDIKTDKNIWTWDNIEGHDVGVIYVRDEQGAIFFKRTNTLKNDFFKTENLTKSTEGDIL